MCQTKCTCSLCGSKPPVDRLKALLKMTEKIRGQPRFPSFGAAKQWLTSRVKEYDDATGQDTEGLPDKRFKGGSDWKPSEESNQMSYYRGRRDGLVEALKLLGETQLEKGGVAAVLNTIAAALDGDVLWGAPRSAEGYAQAILNLKETRDYHKKFTVKLSDGLAASNRRILEITKELEEQKAKSEEYLKEWRGEVEKVQRIKKAHEDEVKRAVEIPSTSAYIRVQRLLAWLADHYVPLGRLASLVHSSIYSNHHSAIVESPTNQLVTELFSDKPIAK